MNRIVIIIAFFFAYPIFSQLTDSLTFRSLSLFDLPAYNEKIESQKIRLGMYTNEINLDSGKIIKEFPNLRKGWVIWHLLPHWSADEAGLLIGDTILGVDGRPLFDSVSRGDEFLELFIYNMSDGDTIYLNVLKNGFQRLFPIKLIGLKVVNMPFIDPGLGEFRKDSWLQKQISDFNLSDWINDIRKQMATVGNTDYNKVNFSKSPLPWRLNAVTYLHTNPTRLGAYSRYITDGLWKSSLNSSNLSELILKTAKFLDIPAKGTNIKLPENNKELDDFINQINNYLESAYKNVKDLAGTVEKMRRILDFENNWEENLDTIKEPRLRKIVRTKQEDELAALFRNVSQTDFVSLAEAASMAGLLADSSWLVKFRNYITNYFKEKKDYPGVTGKILHSWKTQSGTCIIGSEDDNRYNSDFQLIIDIGGNDVYELPKPEPGKLRFVADLTGNDVYMSDGYGQASGAGCLDVLIDLKGNDTYRSKYFSQGAGLLGAGILADYEGDDIYTSSWCSQGAAFFGIGILFDKNGNDNYFADVYSQGFGYIKGIGIIMEQNGNDSYKAGWKIPDSRDPKRAHLGMSQGFGYGMRPWSLGIHADGGIGILTDYSGHDVYNSDFFSQGGSYWFALGILHDYKGCDRYTAGQYSQGSGIHLSFGALLDDEGNDMYDAYAGLEQGNAHDLSAGCLEDNEGDDTYRGYGSSQGSALTVAFAWLLDWQGNDMYICNPADTALSQGGGRFNTPRKAGSLGILLDLGKGNDVYTEPRVLPGKAVLKGRKGIIFDDGKKE